jgi:Coenzyme PQQ synthesis protein D (PqqD).
MTNPKAREEGLLIEQIGDEVVVYDQQRKRASRLNKTVGLVWRQCDGTKSVAEIVEYLKKELNEVADENLVLLSLSQLDAAHLLQESPKLTSQQTRTSRREFVRKVGAVGVMSVLLPLITTMAVPTPAQAQSCQPCGCLGCTCPCVACGCTCPCVFCLGCTCPCTSCLCTLCAGCSSPSK